MMSESLEYTKIWRKPVSNVYEENRRILHCDLDRFVCRCQFHMDIRGRCHPYKLSYGQNDDLDDEYGEYKKFIEASYQTCPYKLLCAHYFIQNDAHSCDINVEDQEELHSFVSSYEELFSLNECDVETLCKIMVIDHHNEWFDNMEEIEEVYQKVLKAISEKTD